MMGIPSQVHGIGIGRIRGVLPAIMVAVPLTAQDTRIDQSNLVGLDCTCYPGDREGYDVADGGFAPLSYTTVEPDGGAADNQRELGTTWGGGGQQRHGPGEHRGTSSFRDPRSKGDSYADRVSAVHFRRLDRDRLEHTDH